jgi:hypothetical protein
MTVSDGSVEKTFSVSNFDGQPEVKELQDENSGTGAEGTLAR